MKIHRHVNVLLEFCIHQFLNYNPHHHLDFWFDGRRIQTQKSGKCSVGQWIWKGISMGDLRDDFSYNILHLWHLDLHIYYTYNRDEYFLGPFLAFMESLNPHQLWMEFLSQMLTTLTSAISFTLYAFSFSNVGCFNINDFINFGRFFLLKCGLL